MPLVLTVSVGINPISIKPQREPQSRQMDLLTVPSIDAKYPPSSWVSPWSKNKGFQTTVDPKVEAILETVTTRTILEAWRELQASGTNVSLHTMALKTAEMLATMYELDLELRVELTRELAARLANDGQNEKTVE